MEDLGRGPVAQGLMGPEPVVEPEVVFQPYLGSRTLASAFKYTSSYFTIRHSHSTKMLSEYRLFPSMLIFTQCSWMAWVNSRLMN